jgi:hypothetical protein
VDDGHVVIIYQHRKQRKHKGDITHLHDTGQQALRVAPHVFDIAREQRHQRVALGGSDLFDDEALVGGEEEDRACSTNPTTCEMSLHETLAKGRATPVTRRLGE